MCLKHIVLSGSDLDAKARRNAKVAARIVTVATAAVVDTAEDAAAGVTR